MSYFSVNWHCIIKKHPILALVFIIKFIFIIIVAIILSYISLAYKSVLWNEIVLYILFPIIFLLINYSFFKLILSLIEYNNYLFIIDKEQIFVINSSLFLRNDIEVIDAFKIIKIDAFSRWLLANLFWYWKIVIELQTKEERFFRFMPKPFLLLEKLKKQKNDLLEERKTKYIKQEN